ncbi:ferritin-like domain-containing protein [Bacillus altitudinis]|uniref:ferritin-like domain-containing protein n=1 Tax=Bacillus altitudinis TaxID=293387 RepID=UPI0024A92292|nr:ferritin-like domain-containing protein [Bacillus altitudinis]WHF28075.1 ferritin-like domain-containing protein [Bacillus altitudinis]
MYYGYYDYSPYDMRQNTRIIADLEKAINGEYSAIQCYEKLAQKAKNPEAKKIIQEIRQDEVRHYQLFKKLYYSLTGKNHKPSITEPCPDQFREGLLFAFKDEQKTVDFYLTVSDYVRDQGTKELMKRIAQDEQQHAVWFLYLLTHHVS